MYLIMNKNNLNYICLIIINIVYLYKLKIMSMNLKDLKKWMWIEVCEGEDDIEISEEYKKVCKNVGDEEVSGGVFIYNFYLILDKLIKNKMIEFEGGEMDWINVYLDEYGEGENFNEYMNEYNLLK